MLMEIGEVDFASLLSSYHKNKRPLSLNFIRYFWEQMLLCVQAIHDEKIVHTDLKPANFLIVSGQLKLIDFGIANAIGNDTVNISRDSQIGTVSYMAPEALRDTNASKAPQNGDTLNAQRALMKLGRPSDVWSLGCILYQMAYGATPFAHLPMIQKLQAIPNDNHEIAFPLKTQKGDTIAPSLRRCLRGCLQRNPAHRMTINELLNDPLLVEDLGNEKIQFNEAQLANFIEQVFSYGFSKGQENINMKFIQSMAKVRTTK